MLNQFHILAFTHRNLGVSEIGKLHIEESKQATALTAFKEQMGLNELMFLSTCNRVEFIFCGEATVDFQYLQSFFQSLYPLFPADQIDLFAQNADIFSGIDAVEHLLAVASSIDSMVIGEREIITQVRSAFETCRNMQLTGDFIRLVMRQTIETAKKVYTETSIATKPVSVVSLAYHKLRDLNIPLSARILIVGAGATNTNMSRFLRKHGFKNFVVFNRTYSKAENLAKDLNGKAFALEVMNEYSNGFDVIICCTGTDMHLITPELYEQLLQGETDRKVVIDLALPQDLDPRIVQNNHVTHISVEILQKISNQNLKERSKEIQHVEQIIGDALFEFKYLHKVRSVELAMSTVPKKIKEIRETAINEIFKTDLEVMDHNSREVLDKILGYMEKKYMSVPMLMAKEILLKK